MKTPWIMKDYNKSAAADHDTQFRPVDIFDATGKLVFRISNGVDGVKAAERVVRCVNAQALFDDAGIIFARRS